MSERTWVAPVRRAMTRMLSPTDNGVVRRQHPPSAERSAIVDCALYVEGQRQPGQWHYADALDAAREHRARHAFVWLGLHEPGAAEMADIAETYGLHELAVEDAVKAE